MSVRRSFWLCMILLPALFVEVEGQTTLQKEYIYAGGKLIAIEENRTVQSGAGGSSYDGTFAHATQFRSDQEAPSIGNMAGEAKRLLLVGALTELPDEPAGQLQSSSAFLDRLFAGIDYSWTTSWSGFFWWADSPWTSAISSVMDGQRTRSLEEGHGAALTSAASESR